MNSDAMMVAVVSSVIAGAFGLFGKYLEIQYEKGAAKIQSMAGAEAEGRAVARTLNFGLILRQIGLMLLAANILGFVLGTALAAFGMDVISIIYTALFFGTILLAIGFHLIAKKLAPGIPWKHMSVVAAGIGTLSYLLNILILQFPFNLVQLVQALIQPFIAMAIGGGILALQQSSSPTPAPQPSATPGGLPSAFGGGGLTTSPHLFGRSGETSKNIFPIDRQEIIVGRGSESQVQVKDPSVSRVHAKILTSQKGIYIRDENSGIGTFINGRRLSPGVHMLLSHGDMIGIGEKHLFEFRNG